MADMQWKEGDIVRASYKTGEYVGEVFQLSPPAAIVRILAVLRHPTQGDLHLRKESEMAAPLFHQRKALALHEKARIPLSQVQPYSGEVPDYKHSLHRALHDEIAMLEKTLDWAKQSLDQLEDLKKDYGMTP